MARPSQLFRQSLLTRPCRRHIATTSLRSSSTSPQRMKPAAAPAVAMNLKPFSEIPGPIALPMLRHSAHVLPRIGSFHHTVGLGLLEGLRDKYGDLVRLAKASRTRPVLYVFDPDMMQEVYESELTQPPQWERSPHGFHRKMAVTQCPFQGDESKAIWSAIGILLKDGTLLKKYDKVFDDISAKFAQRLNDLRHASNALNEELETEVYRWALETIGAMMFGIRLGCLDGHVHVPTPDNKNPEKTSLDDDEPELCSLSKKQLDELTPAEQLVRCSVEISDSNYLVRSESTLRRDSQVFNNALKTLDTQYSLTEHFLSQALADLNSGELRPEQALINRLRPLEKRILPLASDALLAGVEPLAHSALSMFYHLSFNPAKQQRAHDQIIWAAEAKQEGLEAPELSYITACTKEALRIQPVTGGVVRRSKEEMIIGGFEVPAGVDIVLAHGVTSKSEKQWGRSKAFVPDRWCNEGWEPLRASRAHPVSSMPFGASCPTAGVVNSILSSLLTRMLEKYRLEWHGPPTNIVTTGVNKLQRPYYFVLQNAA